MTISLKNVIILANYVKRYPKALQAYQHQLAELINGKTEIQRTPVAPRHDV